MSKWADYCIVAVRYDAKRTSIVEVEAKADTGTSLEASQKARRATVVEALESGTTFVTAFKTNDGKWSRGEDVRIARVQGQKFLRTDANAITADNLGELPEYA